VRKKDRETKEEKREINSVDNGLLVKNSAAIREGV